MPVLNLRSVHRCGILLAAMTMFLVSARAEDSPATPQAVVLNEVPPGEGVSGGILIRELVRQAVLLTAREEFGLLTRDATLGEVLSSNSKLATPPLDIFVAAPLGDEVAIVRIVLRKPDAPVELAKFQVTFASDTAIGGLTTKLESQSRKELVAVLEQAGFKRQAPAKSEADATAAPTVPQKVLEQLQQLSPIVQFAAIRTLHGELRKSGDSPALLAALARAYANLGTLTELNWSPAHKVFKARALLYAERLQAKSPGTASYATRAYVRALVGLPLAALDDLTQCEELGASKSPTEKLSLESQLIKAYCSGDAEHLAKAAQEGEHKLLAHYLRLLAAEGADVPTLRLQLAAALLQLHPANMRAFESTNSRAPLMILRAVAVAAPTQFYRSVWREVGEIPDLPTAAVKLVKSPPKSADDALLQLTELMLSLLSNEASEQADGKSHEDMQEPSLMVVGNLFREINFLHAWRSVSLQRQALGLNADATLTEMQPLVDGHRYQAFLETFTSDQQVARDAVQVLTQFSDNPHLEGTQEPLFATLQQLKPDQAMAMRVASLDHADIVLRDLLDLANRAPAEEARAMAASTTLDISPETPVVVAIQVAHAWEAAAESAAEWEKEYATDPIVQDVLARRYAALHRMEDATRCLERRIELLPDIDSYNQLAKLQLLKADQEAWVKTKIKSLTLPDRGLEGTTIRVELARHFAQQKDLKTACEYADQAARSGAGWAYQCAAECHELNGDWAEAEANVRENSQRYPGFQMAWYFWCRTTSQGDLTAAEKQAKKVLEQFATGRDLQLRNQAALYHYAEEKDEQALEVLQNTFTQSRDESTGLHAALLADELGKVELRNTLLEQAQRVANMKGSPLGTLIHEFRNALLPEGAIPLDLKSEEVLFHLHQNGMGTFETFCLGKFLVLRGQEETGLRYLQQAATSPVSSQNGNLWAGMMLVRRQVPREPLRASEWAGQGQLDQIVYIVAQAYAIAATGDLATTEQILKRGLDIEPNSAEILFLRGVLRQGHQKYESALDDFNRCKELLPKCTSLWLALAECHDQLGDFPAAIAEYEEAIKLDPYQGNGFKAVAHILATVDDDKIRDGKKAVEYAQRSLTMFDSIPDMQKRAVLAIALAEAGDFAEAIKQGELALKGAGPRAQAEFGPILELFRQNKPFRRPAKTDRKPAEPDTK